MHPMTVLNDLHLNALADRTTRSALPNAAVRPARERPRRLARLLIRIADVVATSSDRPNARSPRRPAVQREHVARLIVRNHGRIGACPE